MSCIPHVHPELASWMGEHFQFQLTPTVSSKNQFLPSSKCRSSRVFGRGLPRRASALLVSSSQWRRARLARWPTSRPDAVAGPPLHGRRGSRGHGLAWWPTAQATQGWRMSGGYRRGRPHGRSPAHHEVEEAEEDDDERDAVRVDGQLDNDDKVGDVEYAATVKGRRMRRLRRWQGGSSTGRHRATKPQASGSREGVTTRNAEDWRTS